MSLLNKSKKYEAIKMTNKKPKMLTHFLTRDASLIAIESWYKGRMHLFKSYTGIDFPLTVFRYRNGAFEFFINIEEFEQDLPILLSKWIQANNEKFQQVYAQLIEGLAYFEKLKNIKYKSAEEILNKLAQVADLFAHGFIGILISHHVPRYHENFLKHGNSPFDESLINQVIKWREAEGNVFFNEGVETINFLIDKIADANNWNSEDLRHLTLEELKKCFKSGASLPIDIIEMRKNSIYFYFHDKVITQNEVNSELKTSGYILEKKSFDNDIAQISGAIANKGYARGKVKLIFNRKQLNNFQEGEILVAPMTSPWYVPIMEKAAAIITDEGGITCHAAIISREMNKPCIIGTKYATKFLKDGDLVEVDADRGIIRNLK